MCTLNKLPVVLLLVVLLCSSGCRQQTMPKKCDAEIKRNLRNGVDGVVVAARGSEKFLPGVSLPKAQKLTGKALAPAPKLSKVSGRKVKGKIMPTSWRVAGAGNSEADGVYSGSPLTNVNGYTLILVGSNWAIYNLSAEMQYTGASDTLPANPWTVGMGASPEPTVTETSESVMDPFGWAWWKNYWLLISGVGGSANSNVQPCIAELGGVDYLVMPMVSALNGGWKGFRLCALTNIAMPLWVDVPLDDADDYIWPLWGASYGQSAAVFSAGDGIHIWAFGQAYLDGGVPKLQFAKYDLSGAQATLVSTVTIRLHTLLISNPVQTASNRFRFVIRDNEAEDLAGDLLYCSYYAGDVEYVAERFLGFELDQPAPVGYTESLNVGGNLSVGGGGIDHRLILTSADEVFYMRRIQHVAAGATSIIPYRFASTSYTRLEDIIATGDDWAQTWGESQYPVGLLFGEFGITGYTPEAIGWVPSQDAVERAVLTGHNAGRHWLLNYNGILLSCGWGQDSYVEASFVAFVVPTLDAYASGGVTSVLGESISPITPQYTSGGSISATGDGAQHIVYITPGLIQITSNALHSDTHAFISGGSIVVVGSDRWYTSGGTIGSLGSGASRITRGRSVVTAVIDRVRAKVG